MSPLTEAPEEAAQQGELADSSFDWQLQQNTPKTGQVLVAVKSANLLERFDGGDNTLVFRRFDDEIEHVLYLQR